MARRRKNSGRAKGLMNIQGKKQKAIKNRCVRENQVNSGGDKNFDVKYGMNK